MTLVFLLIVCLLLGALSDFCDFVIVVLREQRICIMFLLQTRKNCIGNSGSEPETKQQTTHFQSQSSVRPEKIRQVRSKIKSLLVIFSDCEVIFNQ